MKQLSQKEKEKITTRLYWDMRVEPNKIIDLLNKKTNDLKDPNEIRFYRRLLTSCDWYTLLKLIPLEKLNVLLSDKIIESLFPTAIKKRYLYARKVLSK